jgi:sugar (pentulose or hexulose) kinase
VTVGWHAVPGRQALLGAVWAGSALARVLALLGVPVEERRELEALALEADPGPLSLEGLDDDALRLSGITREASPARLYRAALEAVGADGAEVLRVMEIIAGGPARRLVVTGGWAAGEGARAVKRAHLGPFEHSPALSTGARGAALAAGRAAGLWTIDDAPRGVGAPQEVT